MLSHIHRRLAWLVAIPLVLSGVLHFILHSWFQIEGEYGSQPRALEPWLLGLHGASAMGFLLLLGSLLPAHVARLWARSRNRRTGLTMSLVCAALILTGWALYYLGDESWRTGARWIHIALGLAIPFGTFVHISIGRRSRQPRRHRRRNAAPVFEPRSRSVAADFVPVK